MKIIFEKIYKLFIIINNLKKLRNYVSISIKTNKYIVYLLKKCKKF